MDRRDFMTSAAGFAAAQAAGQSAGSPARPGKSQYFELRYYKVHSGDQPRRMNDWNSKTLLPLMKKHGFGPSGFFNVSVGASPTMVGLASYPSWASIETSWMKLGSDPDFGKAITAMEAESPEPPFDRTEATLLRATDYSPEPKAVAERPKTPRVFELRTYESDTYKHFLAINRRFRDHTVKLFAKHGFDQIFYGTMEYGTTMPCLTYLLAFDSLAHREKAWAEFGADPDWVKVRNESVTEGQIVTRITNLILSPMGYSPIQ